MMPHIETPEREDKFKKDIINNPISTRYNTREAALVAAHNLSQKESILEYGVIEI